MLLEPLVWMNSQAEASKPGSRNSLISKSLQSLGQMENETYHEDGFVILIHTLDRK